MAPVKSKQTIKYIIRNCTNDTINNPGKGAVVFVRKGKAACTAQLTAQQQQLQWNILEASANIMIVGPLRYLVTRKMMIC